MCKTSKLSPRLLFSKNITNQVFIALDNDQSGAENEAIFVPNQTSFALERHGSEIKVGFLRLGKGVLYLGEGLRLYGGLLRLGARPLPCCDSSFTSVNPRLDSSLLQLRLGEALSLHWQTVSPRRSSASEAVFLFFVFFAFFFDCFTFKTCKTHTDEGLV